jgi:hypothetical protein
MKEGFALRLGLGDPGPDTRSPHAANISRVMQALQDTDFADLLRCVQGLCVTSHCTLHQECCMTQHHWHDTTQHRTHTHADVPRCRSDLLPDGVLDVAAYGRQYNPFWNDSASGGLPDDNGTTHVS